MSRYKCSDGTWITKAAIDRNVRDAKAQLIQNQYQEFGYNFCEKCAEGVKIPNSENDMSMRILDCAHIESVDSCQKNGHAEKAWDITNMKILCRFHHRIHDKANLKFK